MFKVTRAMAMRPTRMMFMRQTAPLYMRQTARMMKPVPKEEHGGKALVCLGAFEGLKKIPAELIPLGIVLLVAIAAAVFSLGRKLMVDKTLRLKGRQSVAEK
ncbi:hypothetical protein CC80DRAFT_588600 [Byssothecium circinans]|uniref:Uncharacterized protein n=1 Tax=Byssothecium circinans TaxID=147558 RepID=A0A6A5UEF4_9PLEO|nr:hypothetical protein CC80DRAFT_588600 [Byssothecium circinans]